MRPSSTRRALAPAPAVALLAAALISACGGLPPYQSGSWSAAQPTITVPETRPIADVSVRLAEDAWVTMLYVVPGRGAIVVYPVAGQAEAKLTAGTHTLALALPRTPNRDSIYAAAREAARRNPGARASDSARMAIRNDPGPAQSPVGELLLVASPEPLARDSVIRRVEGITIPVGRTEALNTVVNLVRNALPQGARWTAYAIQIDLEES